jgi:hypothetical protein
MAHVRKGHVTASGRWAKHLRFWKRVFWKRERLAVKRDIENARGGGRMRRELDR